MTTTTTTTTTMTPSPTKKTSRRKPREFFSNANRAPVPNRLSRQNCLSLRPCCHSFCLLRVSASCVVAKCELIAHNRDFFFPFFFLFLSFCKRGDDTWTKKNVDVAFVETTLLLKQQQKQETRTTTVRSPTVYVKTIAQRYYQPTYV